METTKIRSTSKLNYLIQKKIDCDYDCYNCLIGRYVSMINNNKYTFFKDVYIKKTKEDDDCTAIAKYLLKKKNLKLWKHLNY